MITVKSTAFEASLFGRDIDNNSKKSDKIERIKTDFDTEDAKFREDLAKQNTIDEKHYIFDLYAKEYGILYSAVFADDASTLVLNLSSYSEEYMIWYKEAVLSRKKFIDEEGRRKVFENGNDTYFWSIRSQKYKNKELPTDEMKLYKKIQSFEFGAGVTYFYPYRNHDSKILKHLSISLSFDVKDYSDKAHEEVHKIWEAKYFRIKNLLDIFSDEVVKFLEESNAKKENNEIIDKDERIRIHKKLRDLNFKKELLDKPKLLDIAFYRKINAIPTQIIEQKILEILKSNRIKPEDMSTHLLSISAKVQYALENLIAPELWEERNKNLKETPKDFIIRVYGGWINEGFARPNLKNTDPKLYAAYYSWLQNRKLKDDLPWKGIVDVMEERITTQAHLPSNQITHKDKRKLDSAERRRKKANQESDSKLKKST